MRSRIFLGETTHHRHLPREHRFRYRMFWFSIDLDELEQLDTAVRGFVHNRRGLVSLCDGDYGGPGEGTISEKITSRIAAAGFDPPMGHVTLLTIPRVAGYVFNPVSFYLCHDKQGGVVMLVAEVRNTFGEMHHYIARPEAAVQRGGVQRFRFDKSFYVSPFLDVEGQYELQLRSTSDELKVTVVLHQEGQRVFSAAMFGSGQPFTSSRLFGTLLRMPHFAALIMIRIHWQALLLRLGRRLGTRRKPVPADPATIPVVRPSLWYTLRDRLVRLASRDRSEEVEGPGILLSAEGESS